MKRGVDYIGFGCGALVVNDKNQVLLMHRTGKSQGGMGGLWSQPGGTVELGEKVKDTIKREIKEELDIDIDLFGDGVFCEDIRTEDGIKKHWVTYSYFGKIISGELKNTEPEKCDRLEWFDLDKIPQNTVEYTIKTIEALKKYLKIR